MDFKPEIINTGSDGNCVVLDDHFMFDCGLSRKKILTVYPDVEQLKAVFVTHRHSDHTNLPFIKYCLKYGIEVHLPKAVLDELQSQRNFDESWINQIIINEDLGEFHYKSTFNHQEFEYSIIPHPTDHFDLTNFAFEIRRSDHKQALYATDLRTVSPTDRAQGISFLGKFDLLMLEGNYDENWLREYIDLNLMALDSDWDPAELDDETLNDWIRQNRHRIPHKISSSLYRGVQNLRHLSKQQARLYAAQHLKPNGQYYEMHRSSMFYEKPDDWKRLMI